MTIDLTEDERMALLEGIDMLFEYARPDDATSKLLRAVRARLAAPAAVSQKPASPQKEEPSST